MARTRGFTRPSPQQPQREAALSVGFILLPDFTLTPFAVFLDALRLAADEGDRSRQINCRWTVIGSSLRPVRSSCGVDVTPMEVLPPPERFHYIAVVGGLLPRNVRLLDAKLARYLQRADAAGIPLIGLCSGTFGLIQAGLMENRRCCIDAYHYLDLVEDYPGVVAVTDRLFVVDRDRITSPGGTSAADVAAYLIARHCGEAWAQKSMHLLVIDQARPPTAPQPQPPLCVPVEHDRLRRAIRLIEQSLNRPFAVSEIARRLNVSVRQLERLFRRHLGMSPRKFGTQTRLRYGLWLLLNTPRRVTEIAFDCGFHDSAHFCRQFRREFGVSPDAARRLPPDHEIRTRALTQSERALPAVPLRPHRDLHALSIDEVA